MEFKLKKNDNASAELKITFNADEIAKGYEKAYAKASTKVKVPGFRPGKAPRETIEKILGDSVTEDAINNVILTGFNEVLPQLEHQPITTPQFSVESFDKKKSLVVKGSFDTRPEVVLTKYKKIKVEEKKVKITDADIQESLEKIRQRLARTQLKDDQVVADGNMIQMEYLVSGDDNSQQPESQTTSYHLGDANNPPGFDEKVLGMKKDETREFDYAFPASYADKNLAGKNFHYKVTLKDVYEITYPEINDDLAIEWGGAENLDELKSKIREDMLKHHEDLLKNRSVQEIFDKIYEESKFEIPASLLEDETNNVYEQLRSELRLDMPMEKYAEVLKKDIAEIRKSFEEIALKKIKSWVTKYKLAEEEGIKVEDADILGAMEKYAMQYGKTVDDVKKEAPKAKLDSFFRERALFEKINDHLFNITDRKGSKELTVKEIETLLNGAPK